MNTEPLPDRTPSKRRTGLPERAASLSTPGGPRRRGAPRERSEHMEARILASAIEEFSEYGFAGARIERISQRAGTVDRMLYYYYGNKEQLYQAVLEKIYADMIGEQQAFVTPDDPVEGMRQLVVHSWDHYESHPHLVRVLMNENLLRGKHIRQSQQVTRTSFPLVETVTTLLEAGQAQGLFRRDVTPEHVLMTIMSLGFFYLSNQHTCSTWMGGDLMSPARRKAWREHICDVVLSSLAPSAERAKAAAPARKTAARRRAA